MIDLELIKHFLDKGIIQVKEKDNTLFDIAGFPHYENVVSNVYAYFLDPTKDHELGSLFLDALQELLQTNYTFISPKIMRECASQNGGRIDLVIQEENNSNNKEERFDTPVILIENKMYHDLLNDFEDYYNSFDATVKKGVLLTIKKTRSLHPEFINITHEQLIDAVFKNIGQLVLNAPYRTIFMLKEFSKNLKNFTMEHEVKTYFEFYQKNRIEVQQVEKLKAELVNHMWAQVGEVPQHLPGLNLKLSAKYNSYLRTYKVNENDPVFFVVAPNIFDQDKSPFITIIVELNKDGIARLDEVNKIPFTAAEQDYLRETTALRMGWLHYAYHEFPLGNADFENLTEFVRNKIETTPLKEIYKKISKHFGINSEL